MARPPKDDNPTKDPKPEERTQETEEGTKVDVPPTDVVLDAFRKVARGK